MQVYNIPASNWDTLCARLEKLTRRAKKLGRKIPVLTKVGQHNEVVDVKKGFTREIFEVVIESEPIAVNGWQFVATIELGDSEVGLIVNRVPGVMQDTDIPAEFRKTTNYCSHCQKNVRRNNVYVVYNEVENRWMQIGRNCLADFLGGVDPSEVVQRAEMLISLAGLCGGAQDAGFFGMGGEFDGMDLMSTLVFTSFVIKNLGWLSRTKAVEYGRTATADIIADAYFSPLAFKSQMAKDVLEDFEQCADRAQHEYNAEAAIDWIRNLPESDRNDYLYNLFIIASHETFKRKHLALACSLLAAHSNSVRVNSEKLEKQKSVHVGDVGKRETFNLEVTDIKYWNSQYGTTSAVFFKDIFGNVLIWKASKDPNLEVGNKYEVSAKVKAHTFYQNRAQTEISHAKIPVSV